MKSNRLFILIGCGLSLAAVSCWASAQVGRDSEPLYNDFLDTEFPFVEATVDMRGLAPQGTNDNLVSRAIVLPLADDIYVCFDTELLRVAGIWKGGFVTEGGIAMTSYGTPLKKAGGGVRRLPRPLGEVHFATGVYPGWTPREAPRFEDPRSRWLDERELGRGPVDREIGEWLGIEDMGTGATLHYRLYGGLVMERFEAIETDRGWIVERSIALEGVEDGIALVAEDWGNRSGKLGAGLSVFEGRYALLDSSGRSALQLEYNLDEGRVSVSEEEVLWDKGENPRSGRWAEVATSFIALGETQGAYAVDEVEIPYPNPWKRRIRPVNIEFRENGEAVVLTFDGDVYSVSGLGDESLAVEWRRIAAGFHEPQGMCIREGDIFVFSRLGVTRLVDNNGDGETDFYEMFCNRFTQSADTRDYPLSLESRPDGSFVISKGGQQTTAPSPHSGRALSISADGERVEVFAYGLRNGYLSSSGEEELIVASDQQGRWVPATPFHIIEKDRFYGFEPGRKRGAGGAQEVEQPALWIPHRMAQSGIGVVWASDSRMGVLEGSLLYIDYQKPSLFRIFDSGVRPMKQTAGMPLQIAFETPLLKGALNPKDGFPYFVGFQVWDSRAKRLEGLCRLRVVHEAKGLPRSVRVSKHGARLSFDSKLDRQMALNPANYAVSSWEYQRTEKYGSAQFRADSTPGTDRKLVHSVLLSEDERTVFLAIRGLEKTMQLEVQYNLFDQWIPVYFTLNEMVGEDIASHGFSAVDLPRLLESEPAPREELAIRSMTSPQRGQELYTKMGCIGCHSIDGTTEGRSGPSWFQSFKAKRKLKDGSEVRVDEEYLRESILNPAAAIPLGYDGDDAGMPSYLGILSDEDVESLVMFIVSLGRAP